MEALPTKTVKHSSDRECGDSATAQGTRFAAMPKPITQMSTQDGDSSYDYDYFIVEEPTPKDMKNDKPRQD